MTKLYVSNLLTGLVFWYGIEKLFMRSIGITVLGIGIATSLLYGLKFLLDIPAGIVADTWSRKGVLIFSACSLSLCALILGTSHGVVQYIVGYLFYAIYLVCTSGTYQALTYDILHEEGRAKEYSKLMGRSYSLFLVGAAIANVASGYIATYFSLRTAFVISILPCLLNMAVLVSIKEPHFHKQEVKEPFRSRFHGALVSIVRIALLRSLLVVWMVLAVAELFKQDFSQLYMLQFTHSSILLGYLWALYAFFWAVGSFLAHYLKPYIHYCIAAALGLFGSMSVVRSPLGLGLFMLQVIVAAAATNLIETHIQEHTPSNVRTSILSVLSSLNTLVMLPLSLLFGWIIRQYTIYGALTFVGVVCGIGLVYWLLVGRKRLRLRLHAPSRLEPVIQPPQQL